VFGSDPESFVWRNSSYSGTGGECVELADNAPYGIAVRDTKNRPGPTLAIRADAWSSFLAALKAMS
jgi:hypothetical protein